ncbi:MAG: hypothetical protein WAV15_03155 [Minisyncoccia bacterium]
MNTFPKKILLALTLSLLTFSTARANEADSLHLYNALENTTSLNEMLNYQAQVTLVEQLADKSFTAAVGKKEATEKDIELTLKEITAKQNSAIEKSENAISTIKNTSGLRVAVLGNNLGTLEFQLVQIKGLQALLDSLISKTVNAPLKMQMREQIETLKQEQEKIEALLAEKEGKFSFLGWLVATL